MKILVVGLGGHMGREVGCLAAAGLRGAELAGGVSPHGCTDFDVPCAPDFSTARTDVDCIIDFSHHSLTQQLLDFAVANSLPLVLATTGQTEEERAAIEQAATQIPLFFSSNCSLGVALLVELAKKTASVFPDAEIEIIEKHHDRKLDAPSGTALTIANALCQVRPDATLNTGRSGHAKRTKEEIGIHAIRLGYIVGEHEVLISTGSETITLKHEAHSRSLFAEGAIAAAAFLQGRGPGLYTMNQMVQL